MTEERQEGKTFSWRFRNNFGSDKLPNGEVFLQTRYSRKRNVGRARNPQESRPANQIDFRSNQALAPDAA